MSIFFFLVVFLFDFSSCVSFLLVVILLFFVFFYQQPHCLCIYACRCHRITSNWQPLQWYLVGNVVSSKFKQKTPIIWLKVPTYNIGKVFAIGTIGNILFDLSSFHLFAAICCCIVVSCFVSCCIWKTMMRESAHEVSIASCLQKQRIRRYHHYHRHRHR